MTAYKCHVQAGLKVRLSQSDKHIKISDSDNALLVLGFDPNVSNKMLRSSLLMLKMIVEIHCSYVRNKQAIQIQRVFVPLTTFSTDISVAFTLNIRIP